MNKPSNMSGFGRTSMLYVAGCLIPSFVCRSRTTDTLQSLSDTNIPSALSTLRDQVLWIFLVDWRSMSHIPALAREKCRHVCSYWNLDHFDSFHLQAFHISLILVTSGKHPKSKLAFRDHTDVDAMEAIPRRGSLYFPECIHEKRVNCKSCTKWDRCERYGCSPCSSWVCREQLHEAKLVLSVHA